VSPQELGKSENGHSDSPSAELAGLAHAGVTYPATCEALDQQKSWVCRSEGLVQISAV
jgi:hypothetical protein